MISLVLGLGNIGSEYVRTRHNIGFEVADRVVLMLKAERKRGRREYDWATRQLGDRRLVVAWPKTYMNLCGRAAERLLEENELTADQMLVVVDDFNLPLGAVRLRPRGSDGGHNGLVSLIETLGTEEFPRLRLGIGPSPTGVDAVDFVLERFNSQERPQVDKMIETAAEAVRFSIDHRLEETMSRYNSNPALPNNA